MALAPKLAATRSFRDSCRAPRKLFQPKPPAVYYIVYCYTRDYMAEAVSGGSMERRSSFIAPATGTRAPEGGVPEVSILRKFHWLVPSWFMG